MRLMLLFIILTLFISVNESMAQEDPFDKVVSAIKEGNAKSLSSCFDVTVELSLPDHENTYSATQGEMIMRDFFKKFPPESCDVIQKGTTNSNTRFAICDYLSGNARFQLYIYLHKENDEFLIQKIKFDEKQ